MPQIYRTVYDPQPEPRRARSASPASSTSSSASTADMLSDLVRTGEASRLRRRGAIRIDHSAITSTSSHPYTDLRPGSPTTPLADRSRWDSDYDPDSQPVLQGHLYRNPLSRFSRIRPRSSRLHGPLDISAYIHLREYDYTLVCGAKITDFDFHDEVEPFKPSILPLYPPSTPSSNKKALDRSTGCGTIVHMNAAPRLRVGMWTAQSAAPSSVIALEASYFDTQEAAKFTQSACGCVKEGVGCAVCGNPLGIRYKPCKAASDRFFLSCNNRKLHTADTSTRLRGPEGPQYWQASSSQSSIDHAIHTFFPDAVTSTPQYDFPPTKSGRRQRAYSDVSIELVSSPSVVTPTFPNGNEGDTDTEEANGVPEWDRLGEEYDRDMELIRNYPEEDMAEIIDVPRPEMILDRFSSSSPIPFSETNDESVPATNITVTHTSWGLPAGNLRHHTQSAIPTPGLNFHSLSDGNNHHPQSTHESFYQQQVLGAWEREREEIVRARNVDNDGRSADARWGLDPDGESEVWGVADVRQSWAADPYDSESADKSMEGASFPGR